MHLDLSTVVVENFQNALEVLGCNSAKISIKYRNMQQMIVLGGEQFQRLKPHPQIPRFAVLAL